MRPQDSRQLDRQRWHSFNLLKRYWRSADGPAGWKPVTPNAGLKSCPTAIFWVHSTSVQVLGEGRREWRFHQPVTGAFRLFNHSKSRMMNHLPEKTIIKCHIISRKRTRRAKKQIPPKEFNDLAALGAHSWVPQVLEQSISKTAAVTDLEPLKRQLKERVRRYRRFP